MKKIIATLLAAMMLLSCILVFSSCAKPAMDLEKAEENLKDKDYIVNRTDNDDYLGVNVEEVLYASKDEDGLVITVYKDAKSASLAYKELKMEYEQELESIKLEIKTYEHMLKKYKDDLKSDEITDYEDDIKELKEELEEMKKEANFGKSGKTVWYGTKDAIKDSRG